MPDPSTYLYITEAMKAEPSLTHMSLDYVLACRLTAMYLHAVFYCVQSETAMGSGPSGVWVYIARPTGTIYILNASGDVIREKPPLDPLSVHTAVGTSPLFDARVSKTYCGIYEMIYETSFCESERLLDRFNLGLTKELHRKFWLPDSLRVYDYGNQDVLISHGDRTVLCPTEDISEYITDFIEDRTATVKPYASFGSGGKLKVPRGASRIEVQDDRISSKSVVFVTGHKDLKYAIYTYAGGFSVLLQQPVPMSPNTYELQYFVG